MQAVTKTCPKCGEAKARDEFSKCAARPDGLQTSCKACNRLYRRRNREEISSQRASYREANRERLTATTRRYREMNGDKYLAAKRAKRDADPESARARDRAWYAEHRDRLAASARARREMHGDKIRAQAAVRRAANREMRMKGGRREVNPLSRNGFVYRLFDASDRLLYVGLTYNVENRLFNDPRNHAETKPWFDEIAFVWVEEFETYADAQEEERHAYATEAPLYNKAPLYPTTDRPSPVAASEFDLETRQLIDL